jgi:DNA-directed RNA polymerase subunit RPC12/RpoP
MLTKEELTEAYKNFNDQKIVNLAMNECKSLREDAVQILENEIIQRKLDAKLLDWIKLERNFFKGAELQNLKQVIKNSECSECGKKFNNTQGFNIHYLSALDSSFNSEVIVCESCGIQLRKKSYLKTPAAHTTSVTV